MKSYFLHDGIQKSGPFSYEELRVKGIESSTLVWFDGLENWTEAVNIDELKEVVIKSPPTFEKSSPFKQTVEKTKKILDSDIVDEIENKIPSRKGKRVFTWLIIVLAVVGLVFIIKNVTNSKVANNNSEGSAKDSIAILNPRGEVHEDWYREGGTYMAIYGQMLNKSSVYSYKDFVVEVKFLTETNTLVDTRQFTIYKSINPLEKTSFQARLDGEAPKGSKNYILEWKLLNATAYRDEGK